MNPLVITVSQLNKYVRSIIDGDQQLSSVFVVGEISNFKAHGASGHLYFSLKDAQGLIRSVMFRTDAAKLRFLPQDGMRVICRGRVSLWERDGQYQFYINDMQPDGVGSLALAFEQVKAKLEAEGLFAEDIKKPLPAYPKKIAVITSETGAALQDILNILGRRYPLCSVLLCPVLVQGDLAAQSMIDALNRVYKQKDIDLILIGRGGGSAEDLSSFNDEGLARTIRKSPVPVVSAVGHETDFTICDFVADLRAPTPSAAAELVVPHRDELLYRISKTRTELYASIRNIAEQYNTRLNNAKKSAVFKDAAQMLVPFVLRKDAAYNMLINAFTDKMEKAQTKLMVKSAELQHLSPLQILARGYSVATKKGKIVSSKTNINDDDEITLKLKDGDVCFTVNQVRYEK